jgi:hypothetical protein
VSIEVSEAVLDQLDPTGVRRHHWTEDQVVAMAAALFETQWIGCCDDLPTMQMLERLMLRLAERLDEDLVERCGGTLGESFWLRLEGFCATRRRRLAARDAAGKGVAA